MNEKQIKELRAHAGKLVAEGRSLSGVFEYNPPSFDTWYKSMQPQVVPNFADGMEWRIAKPKKQLIDWSHPFFKGCATNYEGLVAFWKSDYVFADNGNTVAKKCLRLAKPANDHANWQPFFSTPENDAKLFNLAKMVKVDVRYWDESKQTYDSYTMAPNPIGSFRNICSYRIAGECQDGWTDNPKEAKS